MKGLPEMGRAESDTAREKLTRQVLSAKSLPEIQVATQALRDWITTHPEEKEWMRDGFEQLFLMQEAAEEEAAQFSRTLGQ